MLLLAAAANEVAICRGEMPVGKEMRGERPVGKEMGKEMRVVA